MDTLSSLSSSNSMPPKLTKSPLPPLPIHAFPLSPAASSIHRSSLSDIDEVMEATHLTNATTADQSFTIAHPELLPDLQSRRLTASYCLLDFTLHRTLGTGSFGRVHLVRSKHNTRFYAIKVLSKEKIVRTKQVEHTKSERAMLDLVHHPFIVNLWGTFQDLDNLYMVMDFVAGGELFSLLRKSKRFPDPVAKFYSAEVALALHYLHAHGIIYRDLKPENILLSSDGHIKLTDFGFAKQIWQEVTWTLCGTPDYLAPEIVSSGSYNMSVDWYALGVLIYEMLAGYPPFFTESTNPVALYQRISLGVQSVQFPSTLNPLVVDLVQRFMTSDVSERLGNLKHGVEDIFGHPWFAEVSWPRLLKREITAPYIPTISGDGDSSQFEMYQEGDLSYGVYTGQPDPYGCLFPDFDYTAPNS